VWLMPEEGTDEMTLLLHPSLQEEVVNDVGHI
jgi:hypothetical protein